MQSTLPFITSKENITKGLKSNQSNDTSELFSPFESFFDFEKTHHFLSISGSVATSFNKIKLNARHSIEPPDSGNENIITAIFFPEKSLTPNIISNKWLITEQKDEYIFFQELITEIKHLQSLDKIDEALDFIFSKVEDLLIAQNFSSCNFVLRQRETIELFSNQILIGLLAVTLDWKKSLTNRKDFYNAVKSKLNTDYGTEKAEQILLGLN